MGLSSGCNQFDSLGAHSTCELVGDRPRWLDEPQPRAGLQPRGRPIWSVIGLRLGMDPNLTFNPRPFRPAEASHLCDLVVHLGHDLNRRYSESRRLMPVCRACNESLRSLMWRNDDERRPVLPSTSAGTTTNCTRPRLVAKIGPRLGPRKPPTVRPTPSRRLNSVRRTEPQGRHSPALDSSPRAE